MSPEENFLSFTAERFRIWERRQEGMAPPWTEHPYLATMKFTNVYRVLDYGSQFVLSDLADPALPPVEALLRVFLYRHTGSWSAWRDAAVELGGYPTSEDLPRLREFWMDYQAEGERVFTPAYLVYPQSSVPGTNKVESIIQLTERALSEGVLQEFVGAGSPEARFGLLKAMHGVGDFLAMQTLTDWGYLSQGADHDEDEFVVMGPGARRGAKYLFGSAGKHSVAAAWELVQSLPPGDLPLLPLPDGRFRPPSLMDCQNLLCEFGKLVRQQGRGVPPRAYQAAHSGPQRKPLLPASW